MINWITAQIARRRRRHMLMQWRSHLATDFAAQIMLSKPLFDVPIF